MGMRDLFRGGRDRERNRDQWRDEGRYGRQEDYGRYGRDYSGEEGGRYEGGGEEYGEYRGRQDYSPYGQSGRSDWSSYGDFEREQGGRDYGGRFGRDYERDYPIGGRTYSGGGFGQYGSQYGGRRYGSQYGAGGEYGYGRPGVSSREPGAYGSQMQQQFRGRGPRGYQRSDDRIREDVCDCLTDDPQIDASNLEVMVKNGEVTLSGSVNAREDKRRAADLIEDISGVKDVHNNLRVMTQQQAGMQTATQQPTPHH